MGRALKTKHDTPKYGLIYHASLVGGAQPKNKGKLSRMLAAKAALAIRVDALSETSDSTLGLEQRAKLENRVRSLDEKAARRISGSGKFQEKQQKYTNGSEVQTFNTALDSNLGKRKNEDFKKEEEEEEPAAKKVKVEDEETPKKKKKKKSKDENKEEVKEEPVNESGDAPES